MSRNSVVREKERASSQNPDRRRSTHPGITLDLAPDVLEASLSAQRRRQLVLKVLFLWTQRPSP